MMIKPTFLTAALILLTSASADPHRCGTSTLFGYADLDSLQADINALESVAATTQFIICPGTTFEQEPTEEGLNFNLPEKTVGPIIIQCGDESTNAKFQDSACTFTGGFHHVWVTQVGALTFDGITFEKASRGSVWTGLGMEQISFKDCVWKDNVYAWENSGGEPCPTGCAAAVAGKDGGATSFVNCNFFENAGNSGAVYGEDMNYSFDGCKFENNTGTVSGFGCGGSNRRDCELTDTFSLHSIGSQPRR